MTYKTFSFGYRIYYEDTDAAAIVYHSNYLNFAERARTDAFRKCDLELSSLKEKKGISFVVYSADLKIYAPAKLDDLVEVKINIEKIKGAVLYFNQPIFCHGKKIVDINANVACLNENNKPVRVPDFIINTLS